MDNSEKRLVFNTFARNFDMALAAGNTTNMEASIREILSVLPGTDIPQLNMENLRNFADKIDEIIGNARSNGLDVGRLEIVRDYLRTAYHQRREAYDAIDDQITENENLDKVLNKNVRDKINEVKLAMYLSGEQTTGRTIVEVPDSGAPTVQVRLTAKDIEKFDKNSVHKAMREENIRNRRSRMAVTYSREAVDKTNNVIADLNEVAKLREERRTLEEERQRIADGLAPLDGFDYGRINTREAEPTRAATEAAEYDAINKVVTDNIAELERVTSKVNTYEDLMKLDMSELNRLLITMDTFNASFEKDERRINSFIRKHPGDVRALNLLTQFNNFKKVVLVTRDAIDDIQEVKEGTLAIARDRETYAKDAANMYNENFLLPAQAEEIRYRYVLGTATDKELESFNNSVPDAYRVTLTAQQKRDRAAIASGNTTVEDMYKRNLRTASSKLRSCKKEFKKIRAELTKAQALTKGIMEGRITNYMSYLIHEKGSIPVGYNLYKNMDDAKATKYQRMLGYLEAPEAIDESILHDLVDSTKATPAKDDDKDKDKGKGTGGGPGGSDGPDGPDRGDGPGGGPGGGGPGGTGGGPGGGSGDGSGSGDGGSGDGGSGSGDTPDDKDKDKGKGGSGDGSGAGAGDGSGSGDGSGAGDGDKDKDDDKDKDKDGKKRIKPKKIGKLPKAMRAIAIATGLTMTGLTLAFIFTGGVGIAVTHFLALSGVHLGSAAAALAYKNAQKKGK